VGVAPIWGFCCSGDGPGAPFVWAVADVAMMTSIGMARHMARPPVPALC
jgi:hypothetical protein